MTEALSFRAFAERSPDLIYRYRLRPDPGFENGAECGDPMSIPEKARSVSVSPTFASRGGAVGNCQ